MSGRTHYDVLAVSRTATNDEIREAYRRLARDHHPDRAAISAVGGGSMPDINEAYRVLNDPARRAVYDASLRTVASTPSAGSPSHTPTEASTGRIATPPVYEPARVPWRSLLFFGSIAVIGVFVLAQFTEPGEPPAPDGIIRVGSCVSVEADGFARDANCTGDPSVDLVVVAFVPFDGACPVGTERHQDRQGMGVACVSRPSEIGG